MAMASTMQLTPDDQARASNLRLMKAQATLLLLVATAVYVYAKVTGDRTGVLGYVEATAEAAMVGGIADWFAVTALFRHPLGLPIPHTAIIPKRKDQIGQNLGDFVQDNFLDGDVLAERLRNVGPGRRLGEWLSEPENASSVGRQAGAVVQAVTEVLNDDDVQASIEAIVIDRAEKVPVAPIAGRVIEFAVDGGHHHTVFEATLRSISTVLDDNENMLRSRLARESPWWVPEPVDDKVFERIFAGVNRFLLELLSDPDHQLRRSVDGRVSEVALQLRTSPEMRERGEELKAELLAHPKFREWITALWLDLKQMIVSSSQDADSELRQRIDQALQNAGEALASDPDLQEKVDRWAVSALQYVAEQGRTEVADLIASTVERWDAEETSERIELQVGRDLQFIRINGTLVGGLAGFLIHLLSSLLT